MHDLGSSGVLVSLTYFQFSSVLFSSVLMSGPRGLGRGRGARLWGKGWATGHPRKPGKAQGAGSPTDTLPPHSSPQP
eukprot:scaffold13_cov62-Phaeocystis_antarctica.AAC.1